jgi:hypothetical protein
MGDADPKSARISRQHQVTPRLTLTTSRSDEYGLQGSPRLVELDTT